jgi:hypothetical protein
MSQRSFVRVAAALKEIATILREEGEEQNARIIETLRDHALALDPEFQKLFLSEITGNWTYWFWKEFSVGHSSSIRGREQRRRFLLAYIELALACEAEGCSSVYSDEAKESCALSLRMEGRRS